MKKKYNKPTLIVVKMSVLQIIANSSLLPVGEGLPIEGPNEIH